MVHSIIISSIVKNCLILITSIPIYDLGASVNNHTENNNQNETIRTMEEEQTKDEENRLRAIKFNMSDEQLDQIVQKTSKLKKIQPTDNSPEACATIPSLQLSDLKIEVIEYPIDATQQMKIIQALQ